MDYTTLETLRLNHPAWRLLRAEHAPLAASFLHRVFIEPNVRVLAQADLAEALEDELFGLRERLGDAVFPKPALDYLNDWASHDKAWLRKFYRSDSDEPQFDLTPSTEKAIAWLGTLAQRSFVGTESRLLTLFELLRQISAGTEPDPQVRLADLRARRDQIDAEIERVSAGELPLLDDSAIRDRFQQFTALARELLGDFREVEDNFRALDRRVRERVALWQGGKGALLERIMDERDAIAGSDQGRSFQGFWDFLMSSRRQEELGALLERTLGLAPVRSLNPDARLRRVHYDWLEAGEHTQRTVALLSQQLRRFLDDQAWLENRRIMDLLQGIEAQALALKSTPLPATVMHIADTAASIDLPFERPLYSPALKPLIAQVQLSAGDGELDASALFTQAVVDPMRLTAQIRHGLAMRSQLSLGELCQIYPLQQGLAELVCYLQMAGTTVPATVDESAQERVDWQASGADGAMIPKSALLPRIIFVSMP